jgi:hypothetical protein
LSAVNGCWSEIEERERRLAEWARAEWDDVPDE